MFCRNCGAELNEALNVCPLCGMRVVRLEGGTGFWDMVGTDGAGAARHSSGHAPVESRTQSSSHALAKETSDAAVTRASTSQPEVSGSARRVHGKVESERGTKKARSLIAVILLVLGFICLLIIGIRSFLAVDRLTADVAEKQRHIDELVYQDARLKERVSTLEEERASLKEEVSELEEQLTALGGRVSALEGDSDAAAEGTYPMEEVGQDAASTALQPEELVTNLLSPWSKNHDHSSNE